MSVKTALAALAVLVGACVTACQPADHSSSLDATGGQAAASAAGSAPSTPAATPKSAPKPAATHSTVASPKPKPAAPVPVAPRPTPTPTKAKTVALSTCGAPANPWGYNFCGRGSSIYSPAADVCAYFNCIASFADGVGYMVQCNDGMYSMSGGRSGACSHHGGEGRAVYSGAGPH